MTINTYKPNDEARIEAMKFTGNVFQLDAAVDWAGNDLKSSGTSPRRTWTVKTLEGWVDMPYGHYLIKGTNSEFYPCDPDVFRKRWVQVTGE